MNYIPFLAILLIYILQYIEPFADVGLHNHDLRKIKFRYNMKFDKPYAAPYDNLGKCHWQKYVEDCARHHIVPRSHLEKFYNKLIENNLIYQLPTFFAAYKNQFSKFYTNKSKKDHKDYKQMITNVNNFVDKMINNEVIHDPSQQRPDNFDEFGAYFTWLPKDVLIGIRNREDDPGDGFEIGSKYIISNSEFSIVEKIDKMINDYLAGKGGSVYNIDKELALLLKQKSKDSEPLVPYPYDQNDWSRNDKTGKYRIKKKKVSRLELSKIPIFINESMLELVRRKHAMKSF